MKYDVVIIGSGLGGLVCGSFLARSGKSVLVLERQARPGGCMQSYQRNGWSFDTGFHYVGGLSENQRLHRVFSYLGLMHLPWHRLDADGFDRVTIGQQTFAFAEGYERFAETLAEWFPHERLALQRYVSMLQKVENAPINTLGMYRSYGQNAYHYLHETFHDTMLINVLSGTALKMELRRESLPLFTFAHGNSSFIGSSWRLRGSGQLIVQTLTDQICNNGGDIICNAEVNELIERNGRIEVAKCLNGEIYEGQTFISDIHPAHLFDMIKESRVLKRLFRKRISRLENTTGMFTVSLVLKPKALHYFNHNKFIYRKANVWTFHEDVGGIGGVMVSARVPEYDTFFVRQLDLLTPMPWGACRKWAGTKSRFRGADYHILKERIADGCIALAENEIPGLRSMIKERYTSTPLTYRDYTLTPEGSAYGVRKDSRNLVMTMLSPRTPVANLLLTGQNLMLHGVEGVTMTALKTCAELLGKDFIDNILKQKE